MFKEFSGKTKDEWLSKVTTDLKGKPLESLNWTSGNMSFSPFYHQEDLKENYAPIFNDKTQNSWNFGERILVSDIKKANKQALSALSRGANALCFVLEKSLLSQELFVLLNDIQLEWISTHFILKTSSWVRFLDEFSKVISTKKQDPKKIHCSFQVSGNMLDADNEIAQFQASLDKFPNIHLLSVTSPKNLQKEEYIIKELSKMLQKGAAILSTLNNNTLDLKKYHSTIQFSFGLTDNYFLNIAKIRAFKLLWQNVLFAWDENLIANSPINIHLSKAAQSEDEDYNKIKATTQAMSAVMGGASCLFIHPSDDFNNSNGTSFSRRIALNINHLLQQESYLDRVKDPAAGSYFIENLTNDLAEKVWNDFNQ